MASVFLIFPNEYAVFFLTRFLNITLPGTSLIILFEFVMVDLIPNYLV